jgi:hypothetical protein
MPNITGQAWDAGFRFVVERWPMPGLPLLVGILLFYAMWVLVHSIPMRARIFKSRKLGGRLMVYAVAFVAGGCIMAVASWYGFHLEETVGNFIRNPGFEEKDTHWGSGYLEDSVRNLRHKNELEKLPYVVSPDPEKTISDGRVVYTGAHRGNNCFLFTHKTDQKSDHWGSLSQRMHGLRPGKQYVIRFWAKGKVSAAGAFFITTDYPWGDAEPVPVTDVWEQRTHRFTAGPLDYGDIRFVIQAPGEVWLDDVDMREDR